MSAEAPIDGVGVCRVPAAVPSFAFSEIFRFCTPVPRFSQPLSSRILFVAMAKSAEKKASKKVEKKSSKASAKTAPVKEAAAPKKSISSKETAAKAQVCRSLPITPWVGSFTRIHQC
ncbi:uncharacterized protein LAESUDRAFT_719533, partial [Laetiporus sulphureus 93-53]